MNAAEQNAPASLAYRFTMLEAIRLLPEKEEFQVVYFGPQSPHVLRATRTTRVRLYELMFHHGVALTSPSARAIGYWLKIPMGGSGTMFVRTHPRRW